MLVPDEARTRRYQSGHRDVLTTSVDLSVDSNTLKLAWWQFPNFIRNYDVGGATDRILIAPPIARGPLMAVPHIFQSTARACKCHVLPVHLFIEHSH